MQHTKTLSAFFSFPGFRARSRLQGVFGDPRARLVVVVRQKKRRCVSAVEPGRGPSTTGRHGVCVIRGWRAGASPWPSNSDAWRARAVTR